ncbi:hypothetical protein [Nocardioides daphniae]|uniref:Uncharacterized protein n=1 Tax=Nocardioides daphniae TaxID=402297 RepID=A0A4P7UAW4_9ACTN|nr:hypothetical protein [Nocardioides daphniae]QCC77076.1 hypothetical protein E2C04_07350 [Nocardioides daphniae]GGD19348.1 hypothetical protein GCM10007231_18110 [Nocardioides daphniae]
MKKRHVLAAAGTALMSVMALVPPAHAAAVTVVDGDDSPAAADLLRVRVTHAPRQVRVRLVHDDLLYNGIKAGQGATIFLDTDPEDAGPEYRFRTGLNGGTDYVLEKVDRWQGRGTLVRCQYRLTISWKDDVAVLSMGRGCLGRPETVRAAVKVGETSHEGEEYIDWMTGPRRYTPAVARG